MLVGSDGTLLLRRALWDLSVGLAVDQLCAHHGLPLGASDQVESGDSGTHWPSGRGGQSPPQGQSSHSAGHASTSEFVGRSDEPELEDLSGACETVRSAVIAGLDSDVPTLAQ